MNYNPKVYIIDDDQALCESLSWLIGSIGLVSESFNSAEQFLNMFNTKLQGCILLDIRMPQMSGLELQEQLTARHNSMPLLMITGHGDINMAVRAMKQGAFDFITKPFNDQLLLEQIQKAIAKDRQNDQGRIERDKVNQRYIQLTPREKEIMQQIIVGKLNKEIAYDLGISTKTVELHRAHVMEKMQANSVAELVKLAMAIA